MKSEMKFEKHQWEIEMTDGTCGSCGKQDFISKGGRCLACVAKAAKAGAEMKHGKRTRWN